MKFRFYIALYLAKLSIPALKITKHQGTDFPGWLALKICPNFIRYIAKPKTVVTITGTDGKTTVTNLCNDLVSRTNLKILTNTYGSNIKSGINTCLLKGVNLLNKPQYDIGIIEVDERSSRHIYPYLKPTYTIVTNLFKDSVMRNAHPEYIRSIISSCLPKETKLILNGDDLLSVEMNPENPRVYFGVDRLPTDTVECKNLINDKQICPKCLNKLVYEYRHYHHLGKAHCPKCDYGSPNIDYLATSISPSEMTVIHNGKKTKFYRTTDKLFEAYNLLCAISLGYELGIDENTIVEFTKSATITKTRYNETTINGYRIVTQMSKDMNALACSRVFDYLANENKEDKELFMMISNVDDEVMWSENTCWMYDCDFELLNSPNIKHIIVAGKRCKDFRLRLNIAGVDDKIIDCAYDEKDAIKYCQFNKGTTMYFLHGAGASDMEYAYGIRELIYQRAKEVIK